jgi:hypothetical protein
VLVMTHSHQLDLALVAAALAEPVRLCRTHRLATKRARFEKRLCRPAASRWRIAASLSARSGSPGHRFEGSRRRSRRRRGAADLLIRHEALRAAGGEEPDAKEPAE